MHIRMFIKQIVAIWRKPYQRYQYQRSIHAIRLASAVVLGTWAAHAFSLKHGEWIPITIFVILGTMPYQGAIMAKTWERILGTLLGLSIGWLLLMLNTLVWHYSVWFFISVAIISAFCGWLSLNKKGYIAMLAGLTMCMLLGHTGANWQEDTFMRGWNVIIGALIALMLSQLVPIKSLLVWRFTTADNLNACAKQIGAMTTPRAVDEPTWLLLQEEQRKINARLVKARSMVSAAPSESQIAPDMIENMQQAQRAIVSSVNLMLVTIPKLPKPRITLADEQLLTRHFHSLQRDLRLTARLLKGEWRQHLVLNFEEEEAINTLVEKLPFEWQGLIWTSLTIRAELFSLLTILHYQREHWLLKSEQERLRHAP